SEALQRIIKRTSQPTCPLCRKIIDLNSVITLPQSAIHQGIRNHLPEDNNSNVAQDHNKNISDESSDDEEINIFKLKSQQKFKRSNSTVRKIFKTPKFFHRSLRKANTAYKLGDLETVINTLTEVLKDYPTSYSLQCYRAKDYIWVVIKNDSGNPDQCCHLEDCWKATGSKLIVLLEL
ncbi:2944_t:CDS:2, partial [Cetraspora pellucida]